MKELLSCITASILLASSVIPAAAADTDTAPEEQTAPTAEERVADGLAVYERELQHRTLVKQVSAEDTVNQWNAYLTDFTNLYLDALNSDQELKKLLFGDSDMTDQPEQPAETDQPIQPAQTTPADTAVTTTATTVSTESTTVTTTNADGYEGKKPESIKRKYVNEALVARVKEVMPADEFEKMCANPDKYTLYYMNGTLIIATNTFHTALDVNDKLMTAYHIITLDPIMVAWDLGSLSATTVTEKLYNVVFAMNERNRELAEIEYEMTKMGLWNVKDEDVTIPNHANSGSGSQPQTGPESGSASGAATQISTGSTTSESEESIEERLGKLPQVVYDLTSGNDTYRVIDTEEPVYAIISEQGNGQTGDDTLFFDYELDPGDLEFIRLNSDLFINDPVHEVYIMISEYFTNPAKRVEYIKFADDTVMTYNDVCDITNTFVGTAEDDTFEGYPENNYFWGLEGNDTLLGRNSTNYLLGYEGDDRLSLTDNSFNLWGDNGSNYAYGMDGNDSIELGGGSDFIWGGKGDDLIKSGGGDDIIYYELGDGCDIIDDTTGDFTYPHKGHDIVFLGEGILPDEVQVTFANGCHDYVLHIMKTGETITMPGNIYSGFSPIFPIEEIHFTDGTVWDRLTLLDKTRFLYGTENDDSLTAIVDGNAKYDGSATIWGYDGDDTLIGGSGNDSIYGGKGNDTMRGGSGDDTFYYEIGDGDDLIDMGNGKSSYPQGGYNVLVFGEGITPDEITVERSADDYTYTLWLNEHGGSVTMTGNVVSGVSNKFPIKEIRFADETVWKLDYLEANFVKWIRGTDGDDSINDSGDSDIVFCGKGNDYIRGKTGDDLYIYEKGDGRDTIQDNSIWGCGYNTLQFGEGITFDDLYFENASYNGYKMLRFYIGDRFSYVQTEGISEIVFADGTKITMTDAAKTARPAAELKTDLSGDLTCDNALNADDLVMMKEFLMTKTPLSYWEPADLNQDGVLNSVDLSLLKAAILKATA